MKHLSSKLIVHALALMSILVIPMAALPALHVHAETLGASHLANGDFIFTKEMGGTSDDEGHDIKIDSNGNVYSTGIFFNTVDFDPGPGIYNLSSAGDRDVFVSKLDGNGNFLWAKQFAGMGDDYGASVAISPEGSIYIIGRFIGTVDCDPGVGKYELTSAGLSDDFVVKLDSNGNFIWAGRQAGWSTR